MKQYPGPFKKSQFRGKRYNGLMRYINTFNTPAPEPETVIAYNDVNFIVINNSLYPLVLIQDMVKKKRGF